MSVVLVVVAVPVEVDVVEQDAQDLSFTAWICSVARGSRRGRRPDPHDQDHAVALRGKARPRRRRRSPGAVAHDEVEAPSAVEQLAHSLASDRLGGIQGQRPLVTNRLGTRRPRRPPAVEPSSSAVVSPRALSRPKSRCRLGRRRSESTRQTREPACADTTPKLATEVVFPSPAVADVTTMHRHG
jgi:hypothetical protein